MMRSWGLGALIALALAPSAWSAGWRVSTLDRTDVTLRAAAVSPDGTLHVSGSKGTYAVSRDGGVSWRRLPTPGGESYDFRGVATPDARTQVLMSAGEAAKGLARLFRSTDGGRTWIAVHEVVEPGAFFDTIVFRDRRTGYVLGDPVDGRWFLLRTRDGGRKWVRIPGPPVEPGEAAFAASNSALFLGARAELWISSGGLAKGRVHHSTDGGRTWRVSEAPLTASGTAGLFGGHALGPGRAVVVGGDYKDELRPGPGIAVTADGAGWSLPPHAGTPRLMEGVGRLDARTLIAVGPRGTSVSEDAGRTWRQVDDEAFHAIACGQGTCVAAGGKGRVGVWRP